jgi:hypothetical protein
VAAPSLYEQIPIGGAIYVYTGGRGEPAGGRNYAAAMATPTHGRV